LIIRETKTYFTQNCEKSSRLLSDKIRIKNINVKLLRIYQVLITL